MPVFLFWVLFELSMDYQVFLLNRIHEHNQGSRPNHRLVFAGFASGERLSFQHMGFGVAVAPLVDATIVRSVVIPAAMQLLAERDWSAPAARLAAPRRDRGPAIRNPAGAASVR